MFVHVRACSMQGVLSVVTVGVRCLGVKWWERASFNFTHEYRRENWVFVHGICVCVSVCVSMLSMLRVNVLNM